MLSVEYKKLNPHWSLKPKLKGRIRTVAYAEFAKIASAMLDVSDF